MMGASKQARLSVIDDAGPSLAALLAPLLLGGAAAYPSPDEVLAKAPANAWAALDPASTLYMDLPAGRVVILLAPGFAPKTVANIRQLVGARYFDNSAIVRSQDNYVVQWSQEDKAKKAANAKLKGYCRIRAAFVLQSCAPARS